MIAFEKVALEYQPDLIIVVGDVNSTLACSLVAAKIGIPIAHVEAGVRSFDRTMPEEINRVVTDALAELLFTPSLEANQNLRKEGIAEHKIHFVGNILVDCLMSSLERAKSSQTWQRWGLFPGHYALLTLHRVSNVDDSLVLSQIIEALGEVSSEIPVIFPAHPRTTRRLSEYGLLNRVQTSPGIILAEPLSYLEFLSLMVGAKLVLTDSGGIQAETSVLGVPCLTLRSNTEWPETIREGTNILVGTNRKTILKETLSIIDTGGKKGKRPEKWDGNTATRILQWIVDFLSSV
jgi:UDP-N-acetylglucosamine 2-epimerase (non-hydrolysing)